MKKNIVWINSQCNNTVIEKKTTFSNKNKNYSEIVISDHNRQGWSSVYQTVVKVQKSSNSEWPLLFKVNNHFSKMHIRRN
jgi:beta-glucanase (GH16 family)